MWRAISLTAFVLVLVIGARWVSDGSQVFTKDKVQVVVRDEMFGTESTEWKEEFLMGLDLAGPAGGALLALGAFGWYRSRKRRELERRTR